MTTEAWTNLIPRARELLHRITGYELREDKLVREIVDYEAGFRSSQGRRLALVGDMALHTAVLENWYEVLSSHSDYGIC